MTCKCNIAQGAPTHFTVTIKLVYCYLRHGGFSGHQLPTHYITIRKNAVTKKKVYLIEREGTRRRTECMINTFR